MTAIAPLALVCVPVLAAGALLRRPAAWWITFVALAFEAGLLVRGPVGRVDVLGTHLELEPLGRLILLAAVATAVLTSLSLWLRSVDALPDPPAMRGGGPDIPPRARGPQEGHGHRLHSESWDDLAPSPAVLATLGLGAAALLVRNSPPLAVLLLESAALTLAFVVVRRGEGAARASARYVFLVTLGALALLVGTLLLDSDEPLPASGLIRLAAGLLVVGLAVLVAAFPFHVWLPGVAEEANPEDGALVLALVSSTAVVLVVESLHVHQARLVGQPNSSLLMAAGITSAGAAALLALGPGTARRLAYLASASLGFVLAGLAGRSDVGLVGVLFTVLVVPPAFVLGLLCLREAGAEKAAPGEDGSTGDALVGLAGRRPLLALGLAVAALSLAGVPPLAGFVGRWAVYVTASTAGDGYLFGSMVATALGVLAAGRLVYPTLVPGREMPTPTRPRAAGALVALLSLVVVGLGIHPAPVVEAIQVALAELAVASR